MTDLLAGSVIRYLELSVLIALAFLLFRALRRLAAWLPERVGYKGMSQLGRAVFLTAVLSPFAAHLLLPLYGAPQGNAPVEARTPSVPASLSTEYPDTESLRAEPLSPASSERAPSFLHGLEAWQIELAVSLAAMFLLSGFAVGAVRTASRLRELRALVCESTPLRRLGRVSIVVSDRACVPFSTTVLGRAHVVLPVDLLEDADLLRVALRHELQHYRRADPLWAVILELFRLLFFWHPGARGWVRELSDLQELSCDEALVLRGVPPRDYGACLLRVAEMAVRQRLVASTPMATHSDRGEHLRRRIEMLFRYDRNHDSPRWSFGISAACVIVILALAITSAGSWPSVDELTADTTTWYTDDPLTVRIEVLALAHAATLATVLAKPTGETPELRGMPVEVRLTAELASLESFLGSLILEPDILVAAVTVQGPKPGESRVEATVDFVLQRERDRTPVSIAEVEETLVLIRRSLELLVQEDLSELSITMDGDAATLFVKDRNGECLTDFPERTSAGDLLRQLLKPVGDETRRKAPEIEFETASGSTVKLSSLRGNVVLIDFWASWCAPCETEVEQLKALERQLGSADFEIVGVSLSENRESFETFVAEHQVPWPQRHEDGGWGTSAARAFGVHAIPSHFLVDRDGRYIPVPLGNAEHLARTVTELLNE